jgi:hypothetical protein
MLAKPLRQPLILLAEDDAFIRPTSNRFLSPGAYKVLNAQCL